MQRTRHSRMCRARRIAVDVPSGVANPAPFHHPQFGDAHADTRHRASSALLETGVLPELTYQQAVKTFGQHATAELIYLIGVYCLVSVTLNGFDVPVPEA